MHGNSNIKKKLRSIHHRNVSTDPLGTGRPPLGIVGAHCGDHCFIGFCTCHWVKHWKFCILSTQWIYMFRVILTTNSSFCLIHHSTDGLYNWSTHCSLWGTRWIFIYRMSQEERAKLLECVPYVKLDRYNPKHLHPKLNGYGDNGQRSLKLWQLLHTYWLPNSY